jgi:hypothetical protein
MFVAAIVLVAVVVAVPAMAKGFTNGNNDPNGGAFSPFSNFGSSSFFPFSNFFGNDGSQPSWANDRWDNNRSVNNNLNANNNRNANDNRWDNNRWDNNRNDNNNGFNDPTVVQGIGQQAQSGDVNIGFSANQSGNNSNQCVTPLQFGNTGSLQNAQGVLQYGSNSGDIEQEGSSFVFAPSLNANCDQKVQQSAAASG